MSILMRKEWQKLRDTAKVPKGAVSGVSMGDLFDAYWKGNDWLSKVKPLHNLSAGTKKYIAAIQKTKHKAFAAVVQQKVQKDVDSTINTIAKMANPIVNLSQYLAICKAKAAAVKTPDQWSSFWSGPVRGVGTGFKGLLGIDDLKTASAKMRDLWLPLTKGTFGTAKDDNDVKKRVHLVLVTLNTLQDVGRKNHFWK